MMPSILNQPTNGRFDMYKRAKRHKGRTFNEHIRLPHGTIIRAFPKTPSDHDMKKNTRRARVYKAEIARQVAVAESMEQK